MHFLIMLCLDNSFCFRQTCRSTRYLVRKNLKVFTFSIMLLGRIHFYKVWLTAYNYAQRLAVCGVGAESRWRVFLHSWCDAGLCGYYFILALAKTVTPAGAPGGSRGGLCRCTPNGPLWLESSRGTEGNAIYRLVRYCSGFLS